MPFLVINGEEFPLTDFRSNGSAAEIRRTANGRARNVGNNALREWSGDVYAAGDVEANNLFAAANMNADVVMTGDGIQVPGAATPTEIPVRAVVVGEEYVRDGSKWYRVLSVVIYEQPV